MTEPLVDDTVVESVDSLIASQQSAELDIDRTSDTGNAQRFMKLYGNVTRYVVDNKEWRTWSGTNWKPDLGDLKVFALSQGVSQAVRLEAADASNEPSDEGGASPRARLLSWAMNSESEASRKAVVRTARAYPVMQALEADFDARGDDLVVPNGTIDLSTGNVRKSLPQDLNSHMCAVPYDEDATSPLLDTFLDTFLPDAEDQKFLFAILGKMSFGGNDSRLFPVIIGESTSGKSQLMAALDRLYGSYISPINASVFRANLDDKPRPDLVKAMYTRIAYASEASKAWALHADQIKRLTGGDAIPYRDLYGSIEKAVPRFTPLLVTNVMPRITNIDYPTKRRILVLHFDKPLSVAKEDDSIKKRFVADDRTLMAILARIVRGARDAYAGELKNIPKKYVLATMDAVGEMDHVSEFIKWMEDDGHMRPAPDGTPVSKCVKKSKLHEWYTYWIKTYGDKNDKADQLRMEDLNTSLATKGWETGRSGGYRWLGRLVGDEVPAWQAGGVPL